MTFDVRPDRHLIRPTYRSNRFVLVEVTAPAAQTGRARPPVNLAFVLDRSGSMGGPKIRLAKQAVEEAIARLHDDDRFAIVVYDDRIDVVVPGTLATPEARRTALERLREIDARGSTNLGEGWLRGAEQVALALAAEGVNRCLLLTDGLANVGITDRDALARHAGELRARGVSTTTFGVGEDFDEVLLQAMAAAGGGHFYFIATPASIRDHITSEVGETLEVVARGVTLEISAAEGVRVESLSPYPVRDGRGRTEVVLGDLRRRSGSRSSCASTSRTARSAGRPGPCSPCRTATGSCAARRSSPGPTPTTRPTTTRSATASSTGRSPGSSPPVPARRPSDGTARGDYDGARHAVEATARRIRGYAGRDAELRAILAELEGAVAELAVPMPEMERKLMYARSSYAMRSRMEDGQARKGPDERGS